MNNNILSRRAGEVMTDDPKTIRPQALAVEALRMMNMTEQPITSLFVVENGQPLGIVHIHDCLRAGVA
jgi:arabinose-5-phosphate isomerase